MTERRVLLLYQPIFHPHLAIEPTCTQHERDTPALDSGKRPASPAFAAATADQAGLLDTQRSRSVHALQQAGQQVVHLLQHNAEHKPARKQQQRKAKATSLPASPQASFTSLVDVMSILPASYTRSTHPAFHYHHQPKSKSQAARRYSSYHAATSSPSASAFAHRTLTASSHGSEQSDASGTRTGKHKLLRRLSKALSSSSSASLTRSSSRSLSMSRSGSQSQSQSQCASPRSLLLSPALTRTRSTAPTSLDSPPLAMGMSMSRSGSGSGSHSSFLATAPAPSTAPLSPAEALLQLTDVLRDEDEAAEEAREQLLDRLAILAGELVSSTPSTPSSDAQSIASADEDDDDDDVSEATTPADREQEQDATHWATDRIDVRQAADGESLVEALQTLLQERAYDELILLSDDEVSQAQQQPDQEQEMPHKLTRKLQSMLRLPSSFSSGHGGHGDSDSKQAAEHSRVALGMSVGSLRKQLHADSRLEVVAL